MSPVKVVFHGSAKSATSSAKAPCDLSAGGGVDEHFPAREGIPMQSSMWKLLTVAGIIGIGTLMVLEVQSRLGMPSQAAGVASTAGAPGAAAAASNDTDVTPDATTDLDRMLSASDVSDEQQFALNEPGAPQDGGVEVTPAVDETFVGVAPVNRTVLKDNLADDDNPFNRTAGADDPPKIADSSPAAEPITEPSAAIQPAKTSGDSASLAESKPAGMPTTQFFNGSGSKEVKTPASASKAAPVVASESAKTVTPVSVQSFDDRRTDAKNAAVPQTQTDSGVPDFFLPEAVPEIQPPADTAPPRKDPAADDPLMELPAFRGDSAPGSDSTPAPTDPRVPEGGSVPPDLKPAASDVIPAPASTEKNSPFFEADELVPTPPTSNGGSSPKPGSAFELDPVPELDEPRTPPGSSPVPTPRKAPRDPAEADFPEPSYPDRNSPSGLSDDDMFDSQPSRRDDLDDSSSLPVISDRPLRSTPDRSRGGSDAIGDSTARNMSETMRPQLSIQKRAPDTATVGVSHEYTIVVSNEGESTAYDVVVDDELGNGARLENSKPTADFDRVSGKLSWTIPELAPHARQEITVKITPTGEGTLDGIATVRFKAQVKSETVITAPKLTLEVTGPNEVKVGDEVQLHYVIKNSGSGDASQVILRSVLPPGLKHSEGGDLEYEIEKLRAGDQEEIDLTVVAAEPGRIRTVSEVTTSGVSADKATTDIDIIGSQLTIQRLGPERRFVGRTAKFQNIISNETNFEATNAVVSEEVPEGMRFISADNGGEYNPQNGRVHWAIPRLAPDKQIVLEIELEAEKAGPQQSVVEVVESAGFRSQAKENTVVTVEDYENMTADISRQDAPVAIGETFGFTITIENRGTAVARNVEMVIDVPEEVAIKAAGTRTVPAKRTGNSVRYAIVEAIQPSEKMTFELKLQGERPAQNALVRASLKYEQMKEPLIVTESVTIFDDRP